MASALTPLHEASAVANRATAGQLSAENTRTLPNLVLQHWPAALIWIASSAVLVVHARSYLPFFVDDAFISLRYTQRLLDGHGLTWTEGVPVEGYSNLLWVLLVAVPGRFGMELVLAARVMGVCCTLAALACMARDLRSQRLPEQAPGLAACALFATCGALAAWSVGGLEQPLLLSLLAGALLMVREHVEAAAVEPQVLLTIGGLLALASLTRPDAPLLAGVIVAAWCISRGVSRAVRREVSWIVVPVVIAIAGQLAFRLVVYDDWVPNTFHAKVALTSSRLDSGLDYLRKSARHHQVLITAGGLLALLACVHGPSRKRALPVVGCLVAWTAYVTLVGGDYCPQRRHLLPSLMLLAWGAGDGLMVIARSLRHGGWVALALGLLVVQQNVDIQDQDSEARRAKNEMWHWGGKPIGELLKRHFGAARPLLAVDAAGILPYYAQLPALDMLGLNDRHLTHHRPSNYGTGFVGHELGDADYVWQRAPDLIAFNTPNGSRYPNWPAGRTLLARREFAERYVAVDLGAPSGDRVLLWTRSAGRVGVQTGDGKLTVPGYLVTQRDAYAHEHGGVLGVGLHGTGWALGPRVTLPRGSWTLRAEGVGVQALQCRLGMDGASTLQSLPTRVTVSAAESALDWSCRLPEGIAWGHLQRIVLERE